MFKFSLILFFISMFMVVVGPDKSFEDGKAQYSEGRDYKNFSGRESTAFKYACWTPGVI